MNKYQKALEVIYGKYFIFPRNYGKSFMMEQFKIIGELVVKATPQTTGIRYSVINPEWTAEVCGECDYLISKDDVYCPMCGQKIGWRVEDD